jgi:hypothetical protein
MSRPVKVPTPAEAWKKELEYVREKLAQFVEKMGESRILSQDARDHDFVPERQRWAPDRGCYTEDIHARLAALNLPIFPRSSPPRPDLLGLDFGKLSQDALMTQMLTNDQHMLVCSLSQRW